MIMCGRVRVRVAVIGARAVVGTCEPGREEGVALGTGLCVGRLMREGSLEVVMLWVCWQHLCRRAKEWSGWWVLMGLFC